MFKTICYKKFKRMTIEDLFYGYCGNKLDIEFEWDEPVGREFW